MDEILVSLKDVTKIYGDRKRQQVKAVDALSLDIYRRETLGLVGESGCGKSTTGNLLVHLLKADEGSIFFEGRNVTELSERQFRSIRKDIQMVFQDPYSSINPKKKIGWLLEEPLRLYYKDMSKEEREQEVSRMLREVGLDDGYKQRYAKQLSGGQRQRVAIALALILNPAFVVADEPVSALDVSVQAQILNLMKELQKKYGLTYLFISHDLNVVSYLSDRIAVMYLGNLVEIGTQEQILMQARHPYTKALFSASFQEDEPEEGRERILLQGDVPSPSNPPKGCPFHTRCPYAEERCRMEKPSLRACGDGHKVACHRAS
ncbi:MAG: ATP-binding cassette domain-containing protein [bacterium]|nr:ATP-binding cassette domain-containing protein [bacterium]